jgi:signal transduction histidine kinase
MAWTKQGTRLAVLGYLLVVVVVLGGLAWATILGLRLERADQAAELEQGRNRDLRLALRRLDARLQDVIIRETGRTPDQYKAAVFSRARLYQGQRALPTGMVMQLSPLVATTFEPWLLGHFQVSAVSDWTSPQVDAQQWVDLPAYQPPPGLTEAAETLAALRRSLTPGQLGQMLAEARERDNRLLAPADEFSDADFINRRRQAEQHLRQPPELCDRRDLELMLADREGLEQEWVDDQDEFSSRAGQTEVVESESPVVTSELTGVWLRLDDGPDLYLAFVRTVSFVERETIYQGFVVDWPMLRDLLFDEVRDLFPGASLVPVETDQVENLAELMSYVPVRLDLSNCPTPTVSRTWSPMYTGLLVAWVAALIVLMAAGFGVKGLLTLAERRSQFAYAVSHELRTPLTTFRLYTDMLVDGLVPEESRDEYLKTLNLESQRLTQLVGGVLEYAQLEHHVVQPTFEDVRVGELLEAVRQRFEPGCHDAERQLHLDPNGVADVKCHTDPEVALQIVGVLIDNSCKYARDAADPRVLVTASAGAAGRVRLEVRDFGPGVDRKERRRIFKPFSRGGAWAATSPGTGLGLALAQRWATLLGGRLELVTDRKSQPGACFRLSLPLEPAALRG